jgi:hypothetical protein
MEKKCCGPCHRILDTSYFGSKGTGRIQQFCKECQREYSKQHYYERNERQRQRLREILQQAKSTPCQDCGVQYAPHIMDFDHREGVDKFDHVGRLILYTKRKLLEEIAKCDIVCSNCHRERTHLRRLKAS